MEEGFRDLDAIDTIPSNIDVSAISYLGELSSAPLELSVPNPCTTVGSPDNGEAISLRSMQISSVDNEGWTIVETVLIRIRPVSKDPGIVSHFPVHSVKSDPFGRYTVGYDAAVCVLGYEPWIIETYNTSITSPSILRIVGKGNGSTPIWPNGNIQGDPIANTRYLNRTGKGTAFWKANDIAVKQLWRSRESLGRDYLPSATVGPVVPPHATFLLTSPYPIGSFFYRWCWTICIHRTLSRPARRHPRTGWRGYHSTIPSGVGTPRRTIVCG